MLLYESQERNSIIKDSRLSSCEWDVKDLIATTRWPCGRIYIEIAFKVKTIFHFFLEKL